MIRVKTGLIRPGCAQGRYLIQARGFMLAALRWGNAQGPLEQWGMLAYVPIDPAGNGSFFFSGGRAIPAGATHVWARCYTHGLTAFEDAAAEIPERFILPDAFPEDALRFSALSDLHLSSKPWRIIRALASTESDTVFLPGDLTNDGLPEQFDRFRACIGKSIPDKAVFPVIGNHDVLHTARENGADGCKNYAAFQEGLLAKAEGNGYDVHLAPDGRAYDVRIGDLDVIGLQCVTAGRVFRFPEEAQIDWLEEHLKVGEASRHIILCHAPLLAHNPNRSTGQPYLHKDRRIQEIVNRSGRILFLSGHTHVSPNVSGGNGEYDREHQNIYLDCGSAAATDTSGENGLMSADWKDGCRTELAVAGNEIEIRMHSVESGIGFPRGYYRFPF